ncbi:SseB family protein [Weissella confusa]|uniref:SseB family protein n=1 Tax=Weissella confusa TaxID=1583 RepID=UPI0035A2D4C8
MERVFLNINQTNRELNRKIKQYLKQQTVRGQVRDLRVLARALADVTLLVPVAVSDSDRRTSSSGYTYVIGTPDVQRQQGYTVRDDGRYLVLYTDLAKSRAGHREPNTMQVQMPYVLQKLAHAKNLAGIILNPGTDDVVLPKTLLAEELDGSDTGAVTGTVADDLPIQALEQVAPPVGIVAVGLRVNELSRLNEELETYRAKTERRIDRYARQTWNFVAVIVLVTLALLAVPALGRRGLLPTLILIVLAVIVGRIIPVSSTTRQKAKIRVYEKERALVRMIALEDEIARLSFDEDATQQLDDSADYGTDDLDYINQDVRNTNLVRLFHYYNAATEPDEKEYLLGEIDKQFKKALFVQPIFSEGHVIERDVLGRPYIADDETWVNEFIGDGEGNLYLHLYLKTRDAIKDGREILTIRRSDWISYMMRVNPNLVGVAFDITGGQLVLSREELDQLHYEPNYNRKVPTSYFMPGDLDAFKKPE